MSKIPYVGIDPGKGGAICLLLPNKPPMFHHLNTTEPDIWSFIKLIPQTSRIAIEQVSSRPGQGVSSMFTFGRGYGFMLGCLTARELGFELVLPQKWQKQLGIPPRNKDKENGSLYKKRLMETAQRMYPRIKMGLARADSFLIATWCQRKWEGGLA